jgi:hypothetical protein
MDDGSGEGDYRRAALVSLRPDPDHRGCDIFTRRFRDIYSHRLHSGIRPVSCQSPAGRCGRAEGRARVERVRRLTRACSRQASGARGSARAPPSSSALRMP